LLAAKQERLGHALWLLPFSQGLGDDADASLRG
jgi:hypothetical protein